MKKISIIIVLIIIFTINLGYSTLAYSTSKYYISIPENYEQVSENSFTDEDGRNINIQIVEYEYATTTFLYTEENLNTIVKDLYSNIDVYRDEMKKVLTEKNIKYKTNLTEQQINEYANSYNINSILKKEITTFSQNDYKCFHIVVNYNINQENVYADQYLVVSGKEVFTLSISSLSLEEIDSFENKNIVNSFTINNFSPLIEKKDNLNDRIITVSISALILGGIITLIEKYKRKKKKDNEESENIKNSRKNSDEININKLESESKTKILFCTKCGKQIKSEWKFCNYCGNKLK